VVDQVELECVIENVTGSVSGLDAWDLDLLEEVAD
jgi:hypothetical protein